MDTLVHSCSRRSHQRDSRVPVSLRPSEGIRRTAIEYLSSWRRGHSWSDSLVTFVVVWSIFAGQICLIQLVISVIRKHLHNLVYDPLLVMCAVDAAELRCDP